MTSLKVRDFLGNRRGEVRAVDAILAQKGTSRSSISGLLATAGLAVAAVATKFKTTARAIWNAGGTLYSYPATDNLTFSGAHTVTKQKYGAVLVQASDADPAVISTKVVGSPQAYNTANLAIAALPAADAAHTALGYLTILADRLTNGLRAIGTLAISATPTKFKTTTVAKVVIASVSHDVAIEDLLTFSAAHVVNTTKFGVILVQADAAGVKSTKVPLSPQTYVDAPTALAALPAADANNVALGYITIHAGGTNWTANTDSLAGVSGFVDGTPTAEHDFVANTDSLALVTATATDTALAQS
jgi:hypothetical protein